MPKIKKIIDLSASIEANMRLYPGMLEPSWTRVKTYESHGLQSTRIEISVHGGTHVDSSSHFIEGSGTIDEIPLETLMGEAMIFNLMSKAPDQVITSDDLEECHQDAQANDIVILNSGYEKNVDATRYCTLDRSAAQWLVKHQIKCLAVDMPSLDPLPQKNIKASPETHPAHHIIMKAGIPIVENLINLNAIKDKRVFFCCFPLKIRNCEAAPARASVLEFE